MVGYLPKWAVGNYSLTRETDIILRQLTLRNSNGADSSLLISTAAALAMMFDEGPIALREADP